MLRPQSIVCLECDGELPGDLPQIAVDSCRTALAGLIDTDPSRWRLLVHAGGALEALALRLGRDTGVRTEVISGDDFEWPAVADARLLLYAGERPVAPATLGAGAPWWVAVRAADGQGSDLAAACVSQAPDWLAEVLARSGVSLADRVEHILERSSALEKFSDRHSRRSGRMRVAVEASCALLPLVWLLRAPLALAPLVAAVAGLAGPVLILGGFWWLRRRSMGRIGPRAHLLAEACRSWLATHQSPARPVVTLLSAAPVLRPLLQKFVAEPRTLASTWRADYLRERVDPAYTRCQRLRDQALRERGRVTRWRRTLMNLALTMSSACLLVALHPRSASWLTQFGGIGFDLATSLVGMSLPLGLLVIHSLRSAGSSTRRSERYALQLLHLENLRARFENASDAAALQLLRESERVLLTAALDEYLQAETVDASAMRHAGPEVTRSPERSVQQARRSAIVRKLGASAAPVARVMLAAIPWMALGAALALMWISAKQPETAAVSGRLQELGRLLDPWTGEMFTPQPLAAANGTLVITHGMRDGWHRVYRGSDFACGGPRAHWTTEIAEQVRERTGQQAPQVITLDWSEGARASSLHGLNIQDPVSSFLADLGGVRASAEVTGDFLGIRLARMVDNGQIRRDRPLQLIGQSAGGFVVARAAHILVAMGYPRDLVYVTLLETPEPDRELAQEVVQYATTEFYRTSNLTRVEQSDLNPGIHFARIRLPDPAPASEKAAHDYAPDWYCQTAVTAPCGSDGFGRSPFCR